MASYVEFIGHDAGLQQVVQDDAPLALHDPAKQEVHAVAPVVEE